MLFEKFDYPITIRESHLDTFGHVNNATYLQIMEEARWEFISGRGYGLDVIRLTGLGPTILEWKIRFLKELRLREDIIITSHTLSYDKKIGILAHKIVNKQEEICCEAEMTFGLFDTTARRLVLPTAEWLHAIGKIAED